MSEKELAWTVKLDWLNILQILGFHSIIQIPELKREKAVRRITKTFGSDVLMELDCDELDRLVADDLKELMKKELSLQARKEERIERQMRSKVIPFKRGGIIKIDPRDFKDLDPNADPEEIMKALYKKFMGEHGDDDDENDDDKKYSEDSTGYYI